MRSRRIVILGGGYAGLAAVRRLGRLLRGRDSVLLVDESEAHVAKSRLYEVGVTASKNLLVRFPLSALARTSGAQFWRTRVRGADLGRKVLFTDEKTFPYDYLVLAAGGKPEYYGVPGAKERTISLQTYEGALEGSRRFARLGLTKPRGPRRDVVVCGAGLEGVEVAAAVRQQASPERCSVTVVERGPEIMASSQCTDAQRSYVRTYLERRGVDVRLGAAVREVSEQAVVLASGEALPADLVYWCAGTRREALTGIEDGRAPLRVDEFLQCRDHPEVFGAGDFAAVDPDSGWVNLASAQRAIFHGDTAAENLVRTSGGRALRPARYKPQGELVALGDFDGVGVVRGVPVYGVAAAALKRAVEARYLTELYADLPRSLLGIALGGGSR